MIRMEGKRNLHKVLKGSYRGEKGERSLEKETQQALGKQNLY